jgi:poly(A) polymerase
VSRLEPPWLSERPVRRLLAALVAADIEARFVGGCVRDALLGIGGGDIDLATPARPEQVMAALTVAKVRAVPTGLAHGTVTAVVPPRHFEITTLRRDVETDGRHARVAFDADWEEDAKRRDFTINAIYLRADGTLYDPVGGRADLAARRVGFIGDPAARIAEDVLRILRYYRFEARFGQGEGDAASRAACRAAAGMLTTLSAERVSNELMRLLAVPNPMRGVQLICADGVLSSVLTEWKCIARLAKLAPLSGDPLLRLAALIQVDTAAARLLAERLRLSAAERKRLADLAEPWPIDPRGDARTQRLTLYRLGKGRHRDLLLLLFADEQLGEKRLRELQALSDAWVAPVFPLSGADVTALGIPPGPRVGRLLDAVRRWWEQGDFAASAKECREKLTALAGMG